MKGPGQRYIKIGETDFYNS